MIAEWLLIVGIHIGRGSSALTTFMATPCSNRMLCCFKGCSLCNHFAVMYHSILVFYLGAF